MSRLAVHGDPRDARRLAETGLTGVKNLDPAVAAFLHSYVTISAAELGDLTTSDHARGRMLELTADAEQTSLVRTSWVWPLKMSVLRPVATSHNRTVYRRLRFQRDGRLPQIARRLPAGIRPRRFWLAACITTSTLRFA
jgi:hypothetical protein